MSKKKNNESTINIIYLHVELDKKVRSKGGYGAIINTDGVIKRHKGIFDNTNPYKLVIQAATEVINLIPKNSIIQIVSDIPHLSAMKYVPGWEKYGWFRKKDGKPIPYQGDWRSLNKAASRHKSIEVIMTNPSTKKYMQDAKKLI